MTATRAGSLATQDFVGASQQTFLGADVALNNMSAYFDTVDTGSIGAAGQKWLIMGTIYIQNNSIGSNIVRLYDGTSGLAEVELSIMSTGGLGTAITLQAVVTLSGATTIKLQAKDRSDTTGVVRSTGVTGQAKATSITAIRLS